jgi:hypothetical protein
MAVPSRASGWQVISGAGYKGYLQIPKLVVDRAEFGRCASA